MTKRVLSLLLGLVMALGGVAQNTVEVVVMSLNDFHGGFVRDDYKHIPGAASVVETLDSLRRVYPHSIVVSAGDNFGGSFFYQATRSRSLMPQFFKDCGITLSAVGNHEFDEGQPLLLDRWHTGVECRPQSWDLEYVSANIRCDANSAMRSDGTSRPRFCQPWSVREIGLEDGRKVSVAFVGLTTSSTPRQASASKLGGLSFEGRVQNVLDSLQRLPEYDEVRRSPIRLILSHQGTDMRTLMRGDIRMAQPIWTDVDSASLRRLNDDSFCGILSSHSHNPVCGLVGDYGYPCVQGAWHGQYVGLLRISLDAKTLEVLHVEPTLVPITPKTHFSPKAARLQAQIDELLQTTYTKGGSALGEHLTMLHEDIYFDRAEMKHTHTRMGELVTSSYAATLRQTLQLTDEAVVVGVSHIGGIRAGLQKGGISVMDVGEVLPFDNAMNAYQLTGRQLRALLDFGLHNTRYGQLQYCNLSYTTDRKGHVNRITYQSPQGHHQVVKDATRVYLAADEFVAGGGDGYDPAFFPTSQKISVELPRITDAFINYLRTFSEGVFY